jgi:hypothetical protein
LKIPHVGFSEFSRGSVALHPGLDMKSLFVPRLFAIKPSLVAQADACDYRLSASISFWGAIPLPDTRERRGFLQ